MLETLLLDILDKIKLLTPPNPEDIVINRAQATVSIATPIRPGNPDILADAAAGQPGYDIIPVFNDKTKISTKIWVINDGPGVLFAIASSDGSRFCGESEIMDKETRAFTQVYEIRVRSPNDATKYRVTEYEPGHV